MKIKEYNSENIKQEEIDEVVTRVKVFLLNDKNELYIATSDGGCQLPGGHREDGEELIDTAIREVQEETGIILDKNEIVEPFYCIKHLTRNYKKTGLNRCSEMIYFYARTNKEPDIDNLNLTENEKINKFSINKVNLNDVEEFIRSFITSTQKEINIIIAKEVLSATKEFKEYLLKK